MIHAMAKGRLTEEIMKMTEEGTKQCKPLICISKKKRSNNHGD
jgi:hypothetical protein